MKTIIYSHGFGVDKTARGLFPEIVRGIPGFQHLLFDYNKHTENGLEVSPFFRQSKRLQEELDSAIQDRSDAICLISHSQGAIAPVLLKSSENLGKVIFIAPPRSLSKERMEDTFGSRPGTKRNPNGNFSELPRRDGTITSIPEEYWDDFSKVNLIELYRIFMKKVPSYIVFAQNDEVLGSETGIPEGFEFATSVISIPGNHDFTDSYRKGLVETISKLLY